MESQANRTGSTGGRWRGRCARGVGLVVGAVALYGLVAGLVLPPVIRSQAEKRLTRLAGAPVSIGSVSINPFALRAGVRDFRLNEPGGLPLLTWSNVVVDLEVASAWHRQWRFREFGIEGFRVMVHRDREGRWNLLELARRWRGPGPATNVAGGSPGAGGPPAVFVESFRFGGGAVGLRDDTLASPFELRWEPIDLTLSGVGTRTNQTGTLAFSSVDDAGGRIEVEGKVTVEPPGFSGQVRAESVALARPHPYTDAYSALRPTDGRLSFGVPFRVALRADGLEAVVSEAWVGLTNLVVVERSTGASFASLGEFRVEGISANLRERELRAGRVVANGGVLHARRSPAKAGAAPVAKGDPAAGGAEFNLRGLLEPAAVDALVRDFTEWRFAVAEAMAGGLRFTFEDTVMAPPVRWELGEVGVRVDRFSNHSNGPPTRVEGSLRWGEKGRVTWKGEATLMPAGARVELGLEDIDLSPWAPYVAQAVRLNLNRGTVTAALNAAYGQAAAGKGLVTGGGRVVFRDVAATETLTGGEFIRWEAVELNGLEAGMVPGRMGLEELVVRKLQTSLVVTTNGQLNVLGLLRTTRELGQPGPEDGASDVKVGSAAAPTSSAVEPPHPSGPPPFWEAWPVRLGKLKLEQVSLFAADEFYGGGFKTSVESLDGEITGLALPATNAAAIDLRGRLTASSGFTLTGTLNPDPKRFSADLQLATRKADLAQFTPYTLRFAGYPVTRGELTADVHYRIQGDSLSAENRLHLDQFTLGTKTRSPDAVDLPLKLGVALLKDAEGRIELDLPLRGTLGDPEFRIGPVLWQVVRNLVVKAASAPFRFLGSLFGKGDEELEFVEFRPGTAELVAGHTNRLATIVKALRARPQLSLAILPGFDAVADRSPLAERSLEERLMKLRAEASAGGTNPVVTGPAASGLPEGTVAAGETGVGLTAAERERWVPVLYVKEFGALPEASAEAALPVGSVEATAAAAERVASLWRRLMETTVVPPAEFEALARRRGEMVRSQLVGEAGVAAERVILEGAGVTTGHPGEGKARVAFRLE